MVFILSMMIYKINTQHSEKTYDVKVEGIKSVSSLDSVYSVNGNLKLRNSNIHAVSLQYNAEIEEIYVENGKKVEEGDQLLKVKRLTDNVEFIIDSVYSGSVKFPKAVYTGSILSQYTTVMTVEQLSGADDFYIKVQIPSSVYDNMSMSSADVTFPDLLSEVKLSGTPDKDSIKVEHINNVDYYDIYIAVDDSDTQLENYNLLEGMSVSVMLHSISELNSSMDSGKRYYEIPFSAIVTRNDKNVVFLYHKIGTDYEARMVIVDLINTNGDTAVVSVDQSSSMIDNSFLITQGNYDLSGSEKVKVQ